MISGARIFPPSAGFAIALASFTAVSSAAHAQTTPQTAPPILQTSPLPHIEPQTAPPLGASLPNFAAPGREGALPSATIPVGSVSIIGATAFPAATLNAMAAGLAGQNVPLTKIEAVRRAMVGLYRQHGYVLSTVSMNIDAQGDVQFIVTEGHVVAVKLSQDIGPAGTQVLGFLDHLTLERPVSEASLERWLLLAQQVPGVSVHAVLQAESDDPGALTLIAEVTRQAISALVTSDNRSFKETGPIEGLAVLDVNSATAYGDQTEISMFHTSADSDNFGQVSESVFLGNSGLRLKVYAGDGLAEPTGTLAAVRYHSRLMVLGGQLSYPVLLRRNQALSVFLHLDAAQNLIETEGTRTSFDSLRVGRFAGQYAWQDLWAGNTRDGVSVINLQESEGIPALGASRDGRALGVAGRYREKVDFWKLNGSLARTQTLLSPFPEATVALRLEAGGQFTNDILPSEEEFDLGGSHFTRGYYSGEISGDNAAYATAELQFNTGYSLNLFNQPVDLGAQFYTFYDWGESWTNLASDLRYKVESAGGGVRLGLTRYVELDGEAVERLTKNLDPASASSVPLAETVIYWGVTARY